MRYKKSEESLYYIKADGTVEKITQEKYNELNNVNINSKTRSYTLIWKTPNTVDIIDKLNCIRLPIISLKKVLNYSNRL